MQFSGLLRICMYLLGLLSVASAVGFDGACRGRNGCRGDCDNGLHCQKNDPSWEFGRCYYNPGDGRNPNNC